MLKNQPLVIRRMGHRNRCCSKTPEAADMDVIMTHSKRGMTLQKEGRFRRDSESVWVVGFGPLLCGRRRLVGTDVWPALRSAVRLPSSGACWKGCTEPRPRGKSSYELVHRTDRTALSAASTPRLFSPGNHRPTARFREPQPCGEKAGRAIAAGFQCSATKEIFLHRACACGGGPGGTPGLIWVENVNVAVFFHPAIKVTWCGNSGRRGVDSPRDPPARHTTKEKERGPIDRRAVLSAAMHPTAHPLRFPVLSVVRSLPRA